MFYGHLNDAQAYAPLSAHPVWAEALNYLRKLPRDPEEGESALRGGDMFARVMRYPTVEPSDSRYETHRRYVDLQYTLGGAEIIHWCRARDLATAGAYEDERDLQFYAPEEPSASVWMGPGCFSVYYPDDAHRPKVSDGDSTAVYKVVIKIALPLVTA